MLKNLKQASMQMVGIYCKYRYDYMYVYFVYSPSMVKYFMRSINKKETYTRCIQNQSEKLELKENGYS